MISLIIELGGLAAVGYLGLLGSTAGAVPAAVRALQLFISLAAAMLCFEPVAAAIDPILASIGGRDFSSLPWSLFMSFGLCYGLFLAIAIIVIPPDLTVAVADPLPRRERILGGVMGAVAGAFIVGTTLIVLSMAPLPGWMHIRTNAMYYDLGSVCIRALVPFVGALSVYGEPVADRSDPTARLASEAWADVDGDGVRGEADVYVDRDGSGSFSDQSTYRDLDNDCRRLVGLIEKYSVWCWDASSLRVTNVAPPALAAPSRPAESAGDDAPVATEVPAEDDIPARKPAAANPKQEDEPRDDF